MLPPPNGCTPYQLSLVQKTQTIRLLDVFAIGPLMIYGGVRSGGALGLTLALTGAATIVFNGGNYLAVQRALAASTASLPSG